MALLEKLQSGYTALTRRAAGEEGIAAVFDISRYAPPERGANEIRRDRLLADIESDRPHRLTLVSAPAGYGKSLFCAQWYRRIVASDGMAAWLSLEADDRDPLRFRQDLVRALAGAVQSDRGPDDLDALPGTELMSILRRQFAALDRDLVLFLDDYHFAQSDATEALVFRLCTDHAFEKLRVVLLSHGRPGFPLTRLQLSGQLRTIGTDTLRFSLDETFRMYGVDQASSSARSRAELLHAQTEGWAVALQMAFVLSADEKGGQDIWQGFSGGTAEMGRYLVERVIATLPESVYRFLCATASLPAVCADLGAVVTGDPAARETFRSLASKGLPVFTQDQAGMWLRYHPILRRVLADDAARLGFDSNVALARAAWWFRERGDILSGVRHALLRTDPDLALQFVEAEGGWRLVYLTARGGMSIFRRLSEISGSADLARYPLTTLGLAIFHAKMGHLQPARLYLRRANAPATGADNPVIDRHRRLVHALISLYDDSRLAPAELTALEDDLAIQHDLDMVHHGLLLNLLCFNYLDQGRLRSAIAYGEQSVRCLKDSGAEFGALHLHIHIGQARYLAGDASGAEAVYETLIRDAENHLGAGSDMHAIGQVLLSEVRLVRGDADGVRAHLDCALQHVDQHDTWFDILAAGLMTRLRLALMEKQVSEAHRAIDAARAVASRRGLRRLLDLCDGERVRVLLADGDLHEAERFAARAGLGPEASSNRDRNNLSGRLRGSVPALLQARAALIAGAPETAGATLDWLLSMQTEQLSAPRLVELRTLAIRASVARGQMDDAVTLLSDLAYSVFLPDYSSIVFEEGAATVTCLSELCARPEVSESVRERVLGSLGGFVGNRRDDGPSLTPRERQVLDLLSEGRTNKEIGRWLSASENTVKFHLKNIYTKLGVTTRTGAVSRARDHGKLG